MLTEFRERLRILWKESGLCVKDWARQLDVPYPSLQGWLSSKTDPRASSVAMLARATGVSADWLLGLTDERS